MKTDNKSNTKNGKNKAKKFLIVLLIFCGIGAANSMFGSNNVPDGSSSSSKEATETAKQKTPSKDLSFFKPVSKVRNDTTGKWRISVFSKNIEIKKYALDYYKAYFTNDDEIHAIVNFYNNTTTKISVAGDCLDLTIYEYVDGEEHDANKLFSGLLYNEYTVNKKTGKVEKIQ